VDDELWLDPDTMRHFGYLVVDRLAEHLADPRAHRLLVRATREEMESRLLQSPPERGEGFDGLLDRLWTDVIPYASRCEHPVPREASSTYRLHSVAVTSGCVKVFDNAAFDQIRSLKGEVPLCVGAACPPSVSTAIGEAVLDFWDRIFGATVGVGKGSSEREGE
jgi:hypothetical protein